MESGGEAPRDGSVVAVDGVEVDEDEFSDGEIDAAAEAQQLQTEEAKENGGNEDEEEEEVNEARKVQREELQKLKESFEAQMLEGDKRLNYLLAQSEVFSHFLAGTRAVDKKQKRKSSLTGRTRMTEEAEDTELMKLAQSNVRVTRVMRQPKGITGGTLRAYQLEGLNWMVRLHDNGMNGILADEMGLGKTLQTISLIMYLMEDRGVQGPHLVITPKSTVGNWMQEFQRWAPSIRAVKLLGDKETRARVIREEMIPGQFDVLVTSYEGILKELSSFTRIHWKYLIIDEAHRIKNENSSLSKAVRLIRTRFRLLITGTPLQNNLHELWALLNFLLPDVFDSSERFDEWFSLGSDETRENVVRRLHTVLRPFMLRRVKADVETELPPKIETKLYVGLSQMQREWYQKVITKDVEALNALGGPDRVRLLNVLMQLRKVCNHPYLFEGAEPGPPYVDGPHIWENSGKMMCLHKLLPRLRQQGSRVLIFCQMTRMIDILEDYMRYVGFGYCRIDGNTAGDERDAAVEEFNAPGSDKFCFLLSTRAGGLGLNLAVADIVILYDSDWNPQVDLQAMDRAHRIGQTKQVRVFRLITEQTVEEKIVERAERKLFLDAAVIQQGRLAAQNSKLSKGELMHMVRFGADAILSAREGTITDEDIDTLLSRGQARTEAESAKIRENMQHNLASFSIAFEQGKEVNMFTFEGEDWSSRKGRRKQDDMAPATFINLPQRARKRNYDVNEYFRGQLQTKERTKESTRARRKGVTVNDFQFFDREALQEIEEKESELHEVKQQQLAVIKELNAKKSNERRKIRRRERYAAQKEASQQRGDEESAEEDEGDLSDEDEQGAAASSSSAVTATTPELQRLEQQIRELEDEVNQGKFDLPPDLQERKEELTSHAFPDWTKRDFRAFIASMERNGRYDVDLIVQEVAAETGKPVEQVRRYYDTFWARYEELQDWQKIIERVEKGEKRILRTQEIREALEKKVARHQNPWQTLTLSYGAAKGRMYTDEEDAFLVNMMHRHGYGNWTRILAEIRHAWQFRFDWYFKSRNVAELQRRCDTLIRIIEKENEEVEKAEPSVKPQKRPSTGAPKQTPKSKAAKASPAQSKRKAESSDQAGAAGAGAAEDGIEQDSKRVKQET